MDKFITEKCYDIAASVAQICNDFMPCGHIGVCCLSKHRQYAEKVLSGLSEFEYKITYFEYPDGVEANGETALDLVHSADDIRLFIGVGGKTAASLVARASIARDGTYLLVSATPDLYGIGYCVDCGDRSDRAIAPVKVLVDADEARDSGEYSSAIATLFAHRVELIEKKYASKLGRSFDERKLAEEEKLLDSIIFDDDKIKDRESILDATLRYAALDRQDFRSSVSVSETLIKEVCLSCDDGDCRLLSAIAMLKYFKTVMSVDDYLLEIPTEVSAKCRRLSKLTGIDMSEIIRNVEGRKYERKVIYIHTEYRQDVLEEILRLDSLTSKIIKCAKRFMEDVGYHLGEDFDSGAILEIVRNISPLVDDCSIAAIADALGI